MANDERPSRLFQYERAIVMGVGGLLMVALAFGGGRLWDNTLAIASIQLNQANDRANAERRLTMLERDVDRLLHRPQP